MTAFGASFDKLLGRPVTRVLLKVGAVDEGGGDVRGSDEGRGRQEITAYSDKTIDCLKKHMDFISVLSINDNYLGRNSVRLFQFVVLCPKLDVAVMLIIESME